MRKVELVYLHALLEQTREHLADRDELPDDGDEGETRDVGPYQIQCQKAEHETAVLELADRLSEAVPEPDDRERSPDPPLDWP